MKDIDKKRAATLALYELLFFTPPPEAPVHANILLYPHGIEPPASQSDKLTDSAKVDEYLKECIGGIKAYSSLCHRVRGLALNESCPVDELSCVGNVCTERIKTYIPSGVFIEGEYNACCGVFSPPPELTLEQYERAMSCFIGNTLCGVVVLQFANNNAANPEQSFKVFSERVDRYLFGGSYLVKRAQVQLLPGHDGANSATITVTDKPLAVLSGSASEKIQKWWDRRRSHAIL